MTLRDVLAEDYRALRRGLNEAYSYRKKIFHGQQTGLNLKDDDLAAAVVQIRTVCQALSNYGQANLSFDGFARNSLRKSNRPELTALVDAAVNPLGWEGFVDRI